MIEDDHECMDLAGDIEAVQGATMANVMLSSNAVPGTDSSSMEVALHYAVRTVLVYSYYSSMARYRLVLVSSSPACQVSV